MTTQQNQDELKKVVGKELKVTLTTRKHFNWPNSTSRIYFLQKLPCAVTNQLSKEHS